MTGLLAAAFMSVAVGVQAQDQAAPAQQAPAAPAQQAAPAPPDDFAFTTPAAIVIWIIKPTATADFESVWADLISKMEASGNPDLKAQADGIKLFKADGATAQGVTYFMYINPVKGTYNPTTLIYSSSLYPDRASSDAVFQKLSGSIAPNGIRPVPIIPVQ